MCGASPIDGDPSHAFARDHPLCRDSLGWNSGDAPPIGDVGIVVLNPHVPRFYMDGRNDNVTILTRLGRNDTNARMGA